MLVAFIHIHLTGEDLFPGVRDASYLASRISPDVAGKAGNEDRVIVIFENLVTEGYPSAAIFLDTGSHGNHIAIPEAAKESN